MPRLRDLGVHPGTLSPGKHNAITDVAGVYVGHTTLISGEGALEAGVGPVRTGVTAILPHAGDIFRQKVTAAVYTINGYGKATGFEQVRELGQIETPILLTNTLNVGTVADALVAYMIDQNPAIGVHTSTVNPVVGECNDGRLNDIQGRHVKAGHVRAAIASAASGPVAEGCVGGGTGMVCYGWKGGIGTASRRVMDKEGDGQIYTLGALVQANFGARHELTILGVPVGQHLDDAPFTPDPGSVMVVLATDIPLTARQLQRLARRAAFGLARTGTVCHHGSGDFVIAFTTANRWTHANATNFEAIQRVTEGDKFMNRAFRAVVESVEEAVYNALIAAETMTGRDGNIVHALPHDALRDLLRRYNRLPD